MMLAFLAIAAISLVIHICGFKRHSKSPKTPPGPWNLPIVGNLHWFLTDFPGKVLLSIAKKYGAVVNIKLGKTRVILLNDTQIWKEAFRRPELSGRPDKLYKSVFKNKGLIFSDENRELKQYISRSLKDFGMEKQSFEALVQNEISILLSEFKQAQGKPVLVETIFAIPTVNVIWALLFGKRIEESDVVMRKMSDGLAAISQNTFFLGRNPYFIPYISKIFPSLSQGKFMYKTLNELAEIMRFEIEEHRDSRTKSEVRTMTDDYFDKVQRTDSASGSVFASDDHQHFVYADLFCAAIDSTSTTLEWLILFLAESPNIQQKFQQEIDKVIGNRSLSLLDRESMDFTLAITEETFRLSAVDLLQFHRATQDTQILGYDVPKGALLLPNVYGINRDPDIWDDADVFKPERFLDENGKFRKSNKSIVFGAGRRSCPGEAIARDQIFLFATRIFQTFNVGLHGVTPGHDGKFGVVHHPNAFEAVFSLRE